MKKKRFNNKIKYPTTEQLIQELRAFYKREEKIETKYDRCKSSSVVILGKGDDINKGMLCSRTNKQILLHDTNNNILDKEYKRMNKKNMLSMASVGALMAGDFLGDVYGKRKKTHYDIRCKEKKVAKRRAKNKNKKRS